MSFDPDWWPAPAKLNLMLRITGRRDDGYHQLQTVFQFLDWGDQLQFESTTDGSITLATPTPGVEPNEDLCLRAASLLRQRGGRRAGAVIHLRKQIPMGGGLGGGSSDAATTLVVLNRLWGLYLSTSELESLGLSLGADVPVFVRGCAAWAEGIGEQLTCIEPEEPWYLLLIPTVRVVTAAIFADPELTRDSSPAKMADFLRGGYGNDCEAVVRRRYPEIARALDWLSPHAPQASARLTGTGACVFAAFGSRERAEQVSARVPAAWRSHVLRGVNRSPLHRRLSA